jgi:hypothetical protein
LKKNDKSTKKINEIHVVPGGGNRSEIILYQTEDGKSRIEVRLQDETVWLSQKLMAELFQVGINTINYHIKEVYKEGELSSEATIRKYRIVQNEGPRQVSRQVDFYNLDVIISVGYRVRSQRGTQFRKWATERLREYIVKGFVLDDERLKNPGGLDYFDELLERIRDIRTSERRFYQKITDIYATSIDYDPNSEITKEFFATVQNKMHWAIHGHTAAEIIVQRANADKPNMGLTYWKGSRIRKSDVFIAKNYLSEEELSNLNLLVSQYLDFAELQARKRKSMFMTDWVKKLDDFLEVNDEDILKDAGRISAELGKELAEEQFEKYKAKQRRLEATQPTSDFDKAVKKIEKPGEE